MAESPDVEMQPLQHDIVTPARPPTFNPPPPQHENGVKRKSSKPTSTSILTRHITTPEDGIRKFVQDNIKARRCIKTKRAPPPPPTDKNPAPLDPNLCECGYPLASHPSTVATCGPEERWSTEECTELFASNAFGEAHFIGKNYHTTAKFCRVAHDTDPEIVSELIKDKWGLLPPQLLIHVTGGARDFPTVIKNTEKAIDRFNRGLTSAVDKAKAWIVTGGTDGGVMKMVGNAVEYYRAMKPRRKIICIGTATWGVVNNNQTLIDTEAIEGVNDSIDYYNVMEKPYYGLWPVEYDMSLPIEAGACALNPNHTHFLLVDAGKGRNKFGADVDFTSVVENVIIANKKSDTEKSEEDSTIPMVVLVVEGGPNTLFNVKNAMASGHPVVCLKGLGGAADVLAAAYEKTSPETENSRVSVLAAGFDNFIQQHPAFARLTHGASPETKKNLAEALKTCLARRDLLTIVDITDPKATKLDFAILEAIFNRTSPEEPAVRAQRLLKFAMQWDNCDLAKEHIFPADMLAKKDYMAQIKLDENMLKAIKLNRTEFVQLFNGVGLATSKWLTNDILAKLYSDALKKNAARGDQQMVAIINQIITKEAVTKEKSTPNVTAENRTKNQTAKQLKKLNTIGKILSDNLGQYIRNPYKMKAGQIPSVFTKENGDRICDNNPFAIRDLFLFSLLLNRTEMALHFWKDGTEFIGAALIASMLLKNLAKKARQAEASDIADSLEEDAVEWEVRAMEITKFCYSWDADRCNQLLLRALPQWCFMTPLSIANEAECMDFMSLPACQSLLNTIWSGRMASYTPHSLIFFATFCPPLVYKIKFHQPVLKYQDGSMQSLDGRKRNTVKKVALWINKEDEEKDDTIGILSALQQFYCAPATKFVTHAILSNAVILAIYAFFIVSGMEKDVNLLEGFIWIWMSILALHEVKQAGVAQMILPNKLSNHMELTGMGRCRSWISDGWNIMDVTSYALLLVAACIRLSQYIGDVEPSDVHITIITTVYSASYCVFVLRQMYNFHAAKNLGPYVIAIGKMLVDLSFFLLIFMVIMFAFNVPLVALQFNHLPIRDWAELLTVLKRIVYDPMWYQFETPSRPEYDYNFRRNYAGPVEANGTCNNEDDPYDQYEPCKQPNPIIAPLLLFYLIITNTLLINTLIAMFSYTFDQVKASSDQLWRFYQYDFIREFEDRPAVFPPFMVLYQIISAMWILFKRCVGQYTPYADTQFAKFYGPEFVGLPERGEQIFGTLQDSNYRKLTDFERHGLDQYKEQQDAKSKADTQEQLVEINERVTLVADELEHNAAKANLEARIDQLTSQNNELKTQMNTQFAEIIKLLNAKN